ncbi:MAG TPA: hypothetical protein VM327_02310 [Candidatus Thermoplasmatota archaeon]|nr:hypothetical protein [Candidatus Thermoplasmatota archaeon]
MPEPSGPPFVIVEFAQPDTPLAAFTLHLDGATVDLISEPALLVGEDLVHPSVVLIRGAPASDLSALLKRLATLWDLETIERDDSRRSWMGRMRIKDSMLGHDPGAQVIMQFQHLFGAPWMHIEQGTIHLRARIVDPARAELLADEMRRYFAQVGVEAQVELREISAKDYGVWDELVQRAIGLSP